MKILMTCFDIHPTKGSEASVGWNFAYGMSKIHEVHVIAEESKRADISTWLQEHQECTMKMFYIKSNFNWTMVKFWPPSLYKYIDKWERLAADLVIRLDKQENYDIVHKVTLTGFRSTGYLNEVGKPVVWGPIGGFQMSPWCLLPSLGLKALIFYGFRNILNIFDVRWNSRVKKFASHVCILAATQDAQKAIRKYWKCDSILMPEVGFVESSLLCKTDIWGGKVPFLFTIGWSSMFYPRKALNLLFEAVAISKHKEKIRIEVIGGSPQNDYYEKRWIKLGEKLRLNIVWHGIVSRDKSIELMRSCDIFSITSIADMTSTVLLEALSNGLPVIAPNKFGFANVIDDDCGIKIDVNNYKQFVTDYAHAIDMLIENPEKLTHLKDGAYHRATMFMWDEKIRNLENVYKKAIVEYKCSN